MLSPVLEHNRLDLVYLGLLTGLECELVRCGGNITVNSNQVLGLGRIYDRAGQHHSAVECYRLVAKLSAVSGVRVEALRRLALSCRRKRRFREAAQFWCLLLDVPELSQRVWCEASLALAVYYEHRAHDVSRAELFARQAFEVATYPPRCQALEHRVRRLCRKVETDLRSQKTREQLNEPLSSAAHFLADDELQL